MDENIYLEDQEEIKEHEEKKAWKIIEEDRGIIQRAALKNK